MILQVSVASSEIFKNYETVVNTGLQNRKSHMIISIQSVAPVEEKANS
jgi:hypothetical protein